MEALIGEEPTLSYRNYVGHCPKLIHDIVGLVSTCVVICSHILTLFIFYVFSICGGGWG